MLFIFIFHKKIKLMWKQIEINYSIKKHKLEQIFEFLTEERNNENIVRSVFNFPTPLTNYIFVNLKMFKKYIHR